MKKIILTLSLMFTALAGFSQLATIAKQDVQIVRADTANARLATLRTAAYGASSSTLQAQTNATLVVIRKGIDTLNQTGRLQATSALQTAGNATLVAMKKGIDTLNQTGRLQSTAALQTAANATLVASKKGVDTLNQSLRLQATAALQTAGNATLVAIKKSSDTTNQYIRSLKLVVDSINQLSKIKTVTVACTSTNTGSTYAAGYVIGGTVTCYTVSVGSGNWEITGAIMYPTTSSTVLAINVSIFSNTVTTGTDNTAFASSTTFNSRYCGTFNLGTQAPFTGSQVYSSKPVFGTSGQGDASVFVVPTSGVITLLLWANTAFTPPTGQVYNIKLFLKKVN